MLSRPTTAQVINDCRRELREIIGPAVTDEMAGVSLAMLDEVLRNCAERAAHEVAWMTQEIADMMAYARQVAATERTEPLAQAIEAYDSTARNSLHVDDLAADYSLAGSCLAEAIDVARTGGHDDLLRHGRRLLDERIDRENQIKGDWGFVGRS